ncbi:hypothetical protein BB561_000724 [Smittium simulii]|uniref:U3 small nucleolar RNA-associated protein 11 n=1 Tax=Smittium simulii TaxID=133385 RepID=A0A2T9YXU9_9FUNG|nr:hypothetical protein BB561_000724 [Smittium simulii]
MSSFRKSNPRRDHKERAQPVNRSKYGLLEKHKDYVARAKNYHFKQDRLTALRERARNKNEDEFYFSMQKQKTKQGVHITERNAVFSQDFLQLLKTQDANYIRTQLNINANKIDRLQQSLSFEENDDTFDVTFLTEGTFDYLNDFEPDSGDTTLSSKAKHNAKHTIYVDDADQFENFDPSKHFDTPSELLNRKFNRIKNAQLHDAAKNLPTSAVMNKMLKARGQIAEELANRMERQEHLKRALRELEIQNALTKKGPRVKVGKDSMGLAVYKWKSERKK